VLEADASMSWGSDSPSHVKKQILLLSPSRGLGGGIERYVETLEWAFAAHGGSCQRIDLHQPGPVGQARMMTQGRRILEQTSVPTRLVVAHRALLPMAYLLARRSPTCGISVLCHGCDVWDAQFRPRRYVESRLMRRSIVRIVAVSSFTAGAISRLSPATILPPGLSGEWFQTLVEGSAIRRSETPGIHLVTAFRLAAWREKGLPQLMEAIAFLGRSDIHLTVCGSGKPPADLMNAVRACGSCTVRQGLTDRELASQLAAADLFVLATRTKAGRRASGEGFGLVLLEAQVAGTPVVGPAYGGSPDAYIDRVTGVAPIDETPGALANVLAKLLADPQRLAQMGRRAAEWARDSFAPERYAQLVVSRLL
jgi:phosphatidylinositol alpha-1,6-mannosyltransferase